MKNSLAPLSAGADPEIALFSRKEGRIVSAVPVLKRGKDDRIDLGDGYNFYYDGAAVEGNIPPALNRSEFVNNYRTLFNRAQNYLGDKYNLIPVSYHEYTIEECSHPDVMVGGCNPEGDSHALEIVTPPQYTDNYRALGNHFHAGRMDYKEHLENPDGVKLIDAYNKNDVIKLLDVWCGIPMTIIDKDPTAPLRKKLYGKAGRCRATIFGVEYRTLGNYALRSPKLVELVYDLALYVLNTNMQQNIEEVLERFDLELVQDIINNNRIDEGWKFVEKSGLPANLLSRVKEADKIKIRDFNVEWSIN